MLARLRDLAHAFLGFLKAPPQGKALIAEALGRVVWAMVAIRRHGFRGAAERLGAGIPAADASPALLSEPQAVEAFRVGRAVRRAARLLRGPETCFPQTLAAIEMLRRRAIPSMAVIGVQRDADGELASHAWVRAGRLMVVGGDVAGRFQPMVAYVADPARPTA